jgi:hypothetical protein
VGTNSKLKKEEEKMNQIKEQISKTNKFSIVTLVLLLAMTLLMGLNSTVKADAEIDTHLFLKPVPDPIGVGQQLSLQFIFAEVPPRQFPDYSPRYGYWYDVSIKITKPDGTTQTITGLQTGEAAAGYSAYTPDQVGTYQFQASFPGQLIEVGPRAGDYYNPTTSSIVSATVQEDPIESWSSTPLPNDYWETPINAQNREWYQLAGNWLAGEFYSPSGEPYNGQNRICLEA